MTNSQVTSALSKQALEQRLERLPPMPDAAARALEIINRGDTDYALLDRVIGKDPVLAARILRVANSPFYGLPRKIGSIKDACMLTGLPTLRNLVIASMAMIQFPVGTTTRLDRAALWQHCARCAAISAELATLARAPRDLAFTAGLLHDIGKLVLDALFPEEYARVHAYLEAHDGTALSAEAEVLGTTHAYIGARVAESWQLPDAIRDAVHDHHAPPASAKISLTDVIHIADALSHAVAEHQDAAAAWTRISRDSATRLAIPDAERPELLARCAELAATAAAVLATS